MSSNKEREEATQLLDSLIRESSNNQDNIELKCDQALRSLQNKKNEVKKVFANEVIERMSFESIDISQKYILAKLSKKIYGGEDKQLKDSLNDLLTPAVENIIVSNYKDNNNTPFFQDLIEIISAQAGKEANAFEQNQQAFSQIKQRLLDQGISQFNSSNFDCGGTFSLDIQNQTSIADKQIKINQNQNDKEKNPFDIDWFEASNQEENKKQNDGKQLNDEGFTQNNFQNNNDQGFNNWDFLQFGDLNVVNQENMIKKQEKQEELQQQQQQQNIDIDWFNNKELTNSEVSQKQSNSQKLDEKKDFNLSDFMQNAEVNQSYSQQSGSKNKDFSLTDLEKMMPKADMFQQSEHNSQNVQFEQDHQISGQQNQNALKNNTNPSGIFSKDSLNSERFTQGSQYQHKISSNNQIKNFSQFKFEDHKEQINIIQSESQIGVKSGSSNEENQEGFNKSSSFNKGDFILKFGMNESQLRKNVIQQNADIKDDEIDQNLLNPKNITENYLLMNYKQAQLDMRLNNALGSVNKCESVNSKSESQYNEQQIQQSLENLDNFLKLDQNQSKHFMSEEGNPLGLRSQQLSSNRSGFYNMDSVNKNQESNSKGSQIQNLSGKIILPQKDQQSGQKSPDKDDIWNEMQSYKSEEGSKQSLEDSFIAQMIVNNQIRGTLQSQQLQQGKINLNQSQTSVKSYTSKKSDISLNKSQQIIDKSEDLIQKTNQLLSKVKKSDQSAKENSSQIQSNHSLNQSQNLQENKLFSSNLDKSKHSNSKMEQGVNLSQNVCLDQSNTSNNNMQQFNFDDFGMNQSQVSVSSKNSVFIGRNDEDIYHANALMNIPGINENILSSKNQLDKSNNLKNLQESPALTSQSNKKISDSLSQISQRSEQLGKKTQEILERSKAFKSNQNTSSEHNNENLRLQQSGGGLKGLYKEEQSAKIKDLIERSQKSIKRTKEEFLKQDSSNNIKMNKSNSQLNQIKMISSQLSSLQKEQNDFNFDDFGNLNESQSQNGSFSLSGIIKNQIQKDCKGQESQSQHDKLTLDNNSAIKSKQVSSGIYGLNANNFDFDEFGSVHESESNQSKSSIINVIHANTIKNYYGNNSEQKDQLNEYSVPISVGIQHSDDKKVSQQLNFSDFQSFEQSAISNVTQFQDQQNQQSQFLASSLANQNTNNNNKNNNQNFPNSLSQIFQQKSNVSSQIISSSSNNNNNNKMNKLEINRSSMDQSQSDSEDKDMNFLTNLSQFTKNSEVTEDFFKSTEIRGSSNLAELAHSVSSSRSKGRVQYIQHKISKDIQNEDKSQLETLQEQPLKEDVEFSNQYFAQQQQKQHFQDFFGNEDENDNDPDDLFQNPHQQESNSHFNEQHTNFDKKQSQLTIDQKSSSQFQIGSTFNNDQLVRNNEFYKIESNKGSQSKVIQQDNGSSFSPIESQQKQESLEQNINKEIDYQEQNIVKTIDQNIMGSPNQHREYQINSDVEHLEAKNYQGNQQQYYSDTQFHEMKMMKEIQQIPAFSVNQSASGILTGGQGAFDRGVIQQSPMQGAQLHRDIAVQKYKEHQNEGIGMQLNQFGESFNYYQQQSYIENKKQNVEIEKASSQIKSQINDDNQRISLEPKFYHEQNFSLSNKQNDYYSSKEQYSDYNQQPDQQNQFKKEYQNRDFNNQQSAQVEKNQTDELKQQFDQQDQHNDQQFEEQKDTEFNKLEYSQQQNEQQNNYLQISINQPNQNQSVETQEYKLMNSQFQNSNLCSEDSQDYYMNYQQNNKKKQEKERLQNQKESEYHHEVSDENKDSFGFDDSINNQNNQQYYQSNQDQIFAQQAQGQENEQNDGSNQRRADNNYTKKKYDTDYSSNQEGVIKVDTTSNLEGNNKNEAEEEINFNQRNIDESNNNYNTFFQIQKQQVLFTFDHSQYHQDAKRLDMYSKGEIMHFQDQQSQMESQIQQQEGQYTQEFELRKKGYDRTSNNSQSQNEDDDENLIGQKILFTDQIQPTVLETVKENKEPEIDLFSLSQRNSFSQNEQQANINNFNPQAENNDEDDDQEEIQENKQNLFREEGQEIQNQQFIQDEQYIQNSNQDGQQFFQNENQAQNEQQIQNFAHNEQPYPQNNLQEFQEGQQNQLFSHLERFEEEKEEIIEEQQLDNENSQDSQIQNSNNNNESKNNYMLKSKGSDQGQINSMMFQESVINPMGDEIFKSTNKHILDLFPSLQHNLSKGLHSQQNSITSDVMMKNPVVFQGDQLSMIDENIDYNNKGNGNKFENNQNQQSELSSPEVNKFKQQNKENFQFNLTNQEFRQNNDQQLAQGWNFDQQQNVNNSNIQLPQVHHAININQNLNEYDDEFRKTQFGYLHQGVLESGIVTNTKENQNSNYIKQNNFNQRINDNNINQFNEENNRNFDQQLTNLPDKQIKEDQMLGESQINRSEWMRDDNLENNEQQRNNNQIDWNNNIQNNSELLGKNQNTSNLFQYQEYQVNQSQEIQQEYLNKNFDQKPENSENKQGDLNVRFHTQTSNQNQSGQEQEQKGEQNQFGWDDFDKVRSSESQDSQSFEFNAFQQNAANSQVSQEKQSQDKNNLDDLLDFMGEKKSEQNLDIPDKNQDKMNSNLKFNESFDMNKPTNLQKQSTEKQTKTDDFDFFNMNQPVKNQSDYYGLDNNNKQEINQDDSFNMNQPSAMPIDNENQNRDESYDIMTVPVKLNYNEERKKDESFDMNKPMNLHNKKEDKSKKEESFDMNKPMRLHGNSYKDNDDGGLFSMDMPVMLHKKSFLPENKQPVDIAKEFDFLKDVFAAPPMKLRSINTNSNNSRQEVGKMKTREIDFGIDTPTKGRLTETTLIQQVNPNDIVDMEAPAIFMQNTKKSTQSGNSGGKNTTFSNFANNPNTLNNVGLGIGAGGGSAMTPIGGSDGEQQNFDFGSFNSIARIQIPSKKQYQEASDTMQLAHQSNVSLNLDIGVALSEKIDSPNQIKRFDLQMEKEHSNCFVNSLTSLENSKSSQFLSAKIKKIKSHSDIRMSNLNNMNRQSSLKNLPLNNNQIQGTSNNPQLKGINILNSFKQKISQEDDINNNYEGEGAESKSMFGVLNNNSQEQMGNEFDYNKKITEEEGENQTNNFNFKSEQSDLSTPLQPSTMSNILRQFKETPTPINEQISKEELTSSKKIQSRQDMNTNEPSNQRPESNNQLYLHSHSKSIELTSVNASYQLHAQQQINYKQSNNASENTIQPNPTDEANIHSNDFGEIQIAQNRNFGDLLISNNIGQQTDQTNTNTNFDIIRIPIPTNNELQYTNQDKDIYVSEQQLNQQDYDQSNNNNNNNPQIYSSNQEFKSNCTPKQQRRSTNNLASLERSPASQISQGNESFYTVKDKLEDSYQKSVHIDGSNEKKQEDSFYSITDQQAENDRKETQLEEKNDSLKFNFNEFGQIEINNNNEDLSKDNREGLQKTPSDHGIKLDTEEIVKELAQFNENVIREQIMEKESPQKSGNQFRPFALNQKGKMSAQLTSGDTSFVGDNKSMRSPSTSAVNLSIKNIPKFITYELINSNNNLQSSSPTKLYNLKEQELPLDENKQILSNIQENILDYDVQSEAFNQEQFEDIKLVYKNSKNTEIQFKSNESEFKYDNQNNQANKLIQQQSLTQGDNSISQSQTRIVISSKIINNEEISPSSQDFSGNLNTYLSTRLLPSNMYKSAKIDQDYVIKINIKQTQKQKFNHTKRMSDIQEQSSQMEQIQSQGDNNTASEDNCQINFSEINFEKNPFESDLENEDLDHKLPVKKFQEQSYPDLIEPEIQDKQSKKSRRSYKFDFDEFQNPSLITTPSNASPLQKFFQQNNFIEESMQRNILESEFTINHSHLSDIGGGADQMKQIGNDFPDFNNLSPISQNKVILKPELFLDTNQQINSQQNKSIPSQKVKRVSSPPSTAGRRPSQQKSPYYNIQQQQQLQQQQVQSGDNPLSSNHLSNKSQISSITNENKNDSPQQAIPSHEFIDEMWNNMRNESSISQSDSNDSFASGMIQKTIEDQQKDFDKEKKAIMQDYQLQIQKQESNDTKGGQKVQIMRTDTQDYLNDMVNFWNNQNKLYIPTQSSENGNSSRNNGNSSRNGTLTIPSALQINNANNNATQVQIPILDIEKMKDQQNENADKKSKRNPNSNPATQKKLQEKKSIDMITLIEKQSESQVFDNQAQPTSINQFNNAQDFTFEQRILSQNQNKMNSETLNSGDFPNYQNISGKAEDSNINQTNTFKNSQSSSNSPDLQYQLIMKGDIQDSIIDEVQLNNNANPQFYTRIQNQERTQLSEIPTTRTITDSSKNKLSSYVPTNNKSNSTEGKINAINPRQVQSIYQPTQNTNFGVFNQDSQLVGNQQQSISIKEFTPHKSDMEASNQYFNQYPLRIEISSHPEDPKFFDATEKEKDTTKEQDIHNSQTPSTSPKQVFKLATSYLNVPSPQTSNLFQNKVKDLSESPNSQIIKNGVVLPDLGTRKTKSRTSKDDIKQYQSIQEGIVDIDSLPDFEEATQPMPSKQQKDQIKSIREVEEHLERSPAKGILLEKNEVSKLKLQKTEDFEGKIDKEEEIARRNEEEKNKKLQDEFSQIYVEMKKLAEMQLKDAELTQQESFEQKQLSNQIFNLNKQLQLLTQNHAALLIKVEQENIRHVKIPQPQPQSGAVSHPISPKNNILDSYSNSEQKLAQIQKKNKEDDKFEELMMKFNKQKQQISQFRQEIQQSPQTTKIQSANISKQAERNGSDGGGRGQQQEMSQTSVNFNNAMEKQSQFSSTLSKIMEDINSLNKICKKEEIVENQLQKKIKDIQEQVLRNNEKLGEINKCYSEIKSQINSSQERSISPNTKVDISGTSKKNNQSPKTIQDIYQSYQNTFTSVSKQQNNTSTVKISAHKINPANKAVPFNLSPEREASLNAKKQKYLQEYESYSSNKSKKGSLSRERDQQYTDQTYTNNNETVLQPSSSFNIQTSFSSNILKQAKEYLHESASQQLFNPSQNSLLNKLSPSSIRFSSPSNNLASKITNQSPPTQDIGMPHQRQNNHMFSQTKEKFTSFFDQSNPSEMLGIQNIGQNTSASSNFAFGKPPLMKNAPKQIQSHHYQQQFNNQQRNQENQFANIPQNYQLNSCKSQQLNDQQIPDRKRSFSSSLIAENQQFPQFSQPNNLNSNNPQQHFFQNPYSLSNQWTPILFSPSIPVQTEAIELTTSNFNYKTYKKQQENQSFQQKFQLFKQQQPPLNSNNLSSIPQIGPEFQNTNYRFMQNTQQSQHQQFQNSRFFGSAGNSNPNSVQKSFQSSEKIPTFSQSQTKKQGYPEQKLVTFLNEVQPFDEKIDSYSNPYKFENKNSQMNQSSNQEFAGSFDNVYQMMQKNNNVYTPNKDQTILLRNKQYREPSFNYSINQYKKNFVSNFYDQ